MEKEKIEKYLQQQKENLVFVQSRLDLQNDPNSDFWEKWNNSPICEKTYCNVDLLIIQEKIDKATEYLNKQ